MSGIAVTDQAVAARTLDGSVALVTGSRGGIGAAICAALADAGAHVVATGRGSVPEHLRADLWLPHDVTMPDQWADVVRKVSQRFGRLDCLVNNAGISLVCGIAELSIEDWRRVMSVNVESVLLGLQAALPLLRQSGAMRAGGSSVVNVSSTAGLRGSPYSAAYGTSKAAVSLLSKSAAREFAALRYPVRVNSIHPGAVETGMMDAILERFVGLGLSASVEEQKKTFSRMSPAQRMAVPAEIAGSVVFLCSPAASFITGTELVIDGGALA